MIPEPQPNKVAWELPSGEWFRIVFESEEALLAWMATAPGRGVRLDVLEGDS
jgi:hypothetical protein